MSDVVLGAVRLRVVPNSGVEQMAEHNNAVLQGRTTECSFLRGVLVYVLLGSFIGVQFVLQGSVSLMVPELKADIGLDEVEIGLIASLFFYPYVVLQIPSARLVSKLGVRVVMILSSAVIFTGCVIQAEANSAPMMALGRLVAGIGAAPIMVCFLGTIERCFVASLFGVLAAGIEMFAMVGASLGDFLIPDSIDSYGWRFTLLIFAGLALTPAIMAPLLPNGQRPDESGEQTEDYRWILVFSDLRVWAVALYSGLMFAVLNAFGALWGIPYLETDPICAHEAGQMIGMIFLGAALGAPMLGWLTDRGMNALGVMVVCAFGTALLFAVLLLNLLPIIAYYPLLFVMGMLSSAYVLPFIMVKRWLTGEALCVGLAFTNTVSVMIGALLYQPLVGWLVSCFGEINTAAYQQVLVLFPAGVLLAGVLILAMSDRMSSR